MLFPFLIAGLTSNTASPSLTFPIKNGCVHGAMDRQFMVTLKQQAAKSIGRRLDTREDKLSFLHDWFDKFTVGQLDSEVAYSNGSPPVTRSLQTSSLPTHALHFFAATQLAVAVSASEEVRCAHSTHPL